MGKFKIGDIVRFKPREELIKISYLWTLKYETAAGKTVKICDAYNDDKYNLYLVQEGQEILDWYFPEVCFEDPNFNFTLVET